MKSKLKQNDFIKNNQNILIFAFFVFIFHLLFTRLFLKMDDGHFLGIVNSPDFTYWGWLSYRYNTVSGRTIGEFLLSFFLRHNIIFWKIANTFMIASIAEFWIKLINCFCGELEKDKKELICFIAMFTMLVSCLNPSVFWFAGSFSYLWPFAGAVLTVSPLIFYIMENRISTARLILSCFFALIGTMQEQSAALCTAFYLILLSIIFIKKLKIKFSLFLPILPIVICDYFLFTCPGAKGRNLMEAGSAFPQYENYSLLKKLFCGTSSFFANSYYLSNFLIIIFVSLLCLKIYSLNKNKRSKILLISFFSFTVFTCVILNYACCAMGHGLAHMVVRDAFYNENFSLPFYLLFIFGTLLTLFIFFSVICLIKKDSKAGVAIGLCLSAGFCSLLVMSFSPTVFSSGQRVAFFTNMLVITACICLFGDLKKSRLLNNISNIFIIYGFITIAVNCFAFRLIEHPLMG